MSGYKGTRTGDLGSEVQDYNSAGVEGERGVGDGQAPSGQCPPRSPFKVRSNGLAIITWYTPNSGHKVVTAWMEPGE